VSLSKIEGSWKQGVQKNIWTKFGELREGWKKLHTEEFHKLYFLSPVVIRVIKSKKMGWARRIARKGAIWN
jgi:hypothetical protein